jgi:uncharacterized membrane protein
MRRSAALSGLSNFACDGAVYFLAFRTSAMDILAAELRMAFCAKCGAPLSANTTFCATCSPPPVLPLPEAPSAALSANAAGALAYLLGFITGIIFLVMEPYNKNPFVRFHAFQSIFVHVFFIAVFMALSMFSIMLSFLFGLIALVKLLLSLAFVVLWLLLMYKAFKGERFSLPIIGPLAAKLA